MDGVQVVVGLQLPQRGLPGCGHKIAQEQVERILLLCIRDAIGVESPQRCHLRSGER